MGRKRTILLTDQLRQAIDDSGLTRYQIAKATGIDESALAKFYNGHRGSVGKSVGKRRQKHQMVKLLRQADGRRCDRNHDHGSV